MISAISMLRAGLVAVALASAAASPAAARQGAAAPAFTGLKRTVAVDVFGGSELLAGQASADGLGAILTDVLISDGRFVVVERMSLAGVQSEQQLGQGGSSTSETAARSSQLIGASLLVKGAVTKYNPEAGGGGLRVGGMPSGAFGLGAGAKTRKSTVAVSLRLIDTTTGQVVATVSAQGSATSQEADAGLLNNSNGSTIGTNAFRGTSLGKAAEDAIRKAVSQIALDTRAAPWSGLVIDNRGDQAILINAGANQNVQPGMVFGVYRKGEVLTDPGTGAVLDVAIDRVGSIRVDTVREKISVTQRIDGQPPVRGDLLRAE